MKSKIRISERSDKFIFISGMKKGMEISGNSICGKFDYVAD